MPEDGIKKNIQLLEIAPADVEDVARFLSRASGSKAPIASAIARLSWILLENPARETGDPLGWLLRTPSGEIGGCMCCAPQKFCLGETTFRLMMANSFYVDDRYRGMGALIFLKYLELGDRYPLFVSSANATVARMWQKRGGCPLGNSDHEILGIVRWPAIVAESVYRKFGSDTVARVASALALPSSYLRRGLSAAKGNLELIQSPELAVEVCAEHRSKKITSCRDAAFLKWRYFSGGDPTTRVFAFRPGDGEVQKRFMIGVNLQTRGYKQQIRALNVLDIWGEANSKLYLEIVSSLWREYREQIDMLVVRCLDPVLHEALRSYGFKERPFAAPIAWCIDKNGLLPAKPWYFAAADGDMFL